MNLLMISVALALPMFAQEANQSPAQNPRVKDDEKRPMIKLDGEWSVVYAEMDGKKIAGKGITDVTIKNNVVSYRHDGTENSWVLHFGPHNMVRCTEQIGGKTTSDTGKASSNSKETGDTADKSRHHTHHGVYIASQEYFSLCLNKGRDHRSHLPNAGQTTNRGGEERTGDKGQASPTDQTGARHHHFGEHGAHGSHFIVILHRSSAQAPASR